MWCGMTNTPTHSLKSTRLRFSLFLSVWSPSAVCASRPTGPLLVIPFWANALNPSLDGRPSQRRCCSVGSPVFATPARYWAGLVYLTAGMTAGKVWIQAVQFPGSFIYRYIRLRCYVVALRIDPGEASPVVPGVRCAHRQQRVIVLVLDVLLKVPLAQLDQGMHQFILLQGGGEGP